MPDEPIHPGQITEDGSKARPSAELTDLEAWQLLPWLANGTLEAEEKAKVLAHVESSATGRQELHWLGELDRALSAPESDRLGSRDRRFRALMDRIDHHEAEVGPAAADRSKTAADESPRRPSQQDPARRRPAGPPLSGSFLVRNRWAQAALVLLTAGILLGITMEPEPGIGWPLPSDLPAVAEPPASVPLSADPAFRTRSTQATTAVAPTSDGVAADGIDLRMIFEPRVEEEELRTILLEANGEIIAGPTALGVYTVRLAPLEPPVTGQLEATFDRLRNDPRIALVERTASP